MADEDSEYGRWLARLRSTRPFALPAGGTMTEAQLQRFLGVHRHQSSVSARAA